jgi:ATP adenylyltransferase
MDFLWSPWRYQYVANIHNADGCVFCIDASTAKDAERLILFRGQDHFIILNLFPYTCGHLLIAPYRHLSALSELSAEQNLELMNLTQRAVAALRKIYRPDGFNLGMNLGKCAGAGIDQHLHLHIVPRWCGDANFMTVSGETRVLPEALQTTYLKLKPFFETRPLDHPEARG